MYVIIMHVSTTDNVKQCKKSQNQHFILMIYNVLSIYCYFASINFKFWLNLNRLK
uniref:Uncharacterized protein n=1 Tax=Octopus bimaculoides TaxID=37653 RepID=A0A0L8H603_OCTBM